MMDFLVTADGGLTTAGYVTCIAAMVILVVIAAVLFHKKSSSGKLTTQQLVTCAVALALAYATSYLKVFSLPFGGSVTLCSMLFIVLIGYWYGPKIGILTGLVYGIFQFLQDVRPYLEESFDDAEFSLGMNFEPEIDYRFIILFINVSQEKFNNGIGDEIRSFNLKIKSLRKELGIFRDVLVFPEIKYV